MVKTIQYLFAAAVTLGPVVSFSESLNTEERESFWNSNNSSYWEPGGESYWEPGDRSYWDHYDNGYWGSCPATSESELYVQPIKNLKRGFIRGADISTLLEVEQGGGKFYNEKGKRVDPIRFLASKGVNWVRLRLWNDPYDVSWLNTHSEWVDGDGQPFYSVSPFDGSIGGGTNDIYATIQLAKRAKRAGMKVLLDFHYSDFWADPGKQYSPEDWKGMSEDETANAVFNFTARSLRLMAIYGVYPEMVQIGNEINNGLLWDNGGGWNKGKPAGDTTYDKGIRYLSAGIEAVRYSDWFAYKRTNIMLHLAEGGDKEAFENVFGAFEEAGLDYDTIGASYYPYWHGSLEKLQENLDYVSTKFKKRVVVAETSYGFTEEFSPDGGDIFNTSLAKEGGFLPTVQGQATAIREVMNVVAQVPERRGDGIFYWEPAWLANNDVDGDGYKDGAGWVFNEPSSWDNQALFDFEGKALESIDVFRRAYKKRGRCAEPVDPPHAVSVADLDIERRKGDVLNLPETVSVLFNDDAYRSVEVVWDNAGDISTDEVGEFNIAGVAEGLVVSATLVVNANVVENGGFEAGLSPWVVKKGSSLNDTGDNPYKGASALHFWNTSEMDDQVSQEATGIANGFYEVSVWTMGFSSGGSESNVNAVAGDNNLSTPVLFTGWGNWNQAKLCIPVESNTLTINLNLKEAGSSWGEFDEVRAVQVDACEEEDPNLLVNGSFESGELSPWSLTQGTTLSVGGGTPYEGALSLHFWNTEAMNDQVSQSVDGLENGFYEISVWTMGESTGETGSSLSVSSGSEDIVEPVLFSGWAVWNQAKICMPVNEGSLIVNLNLKESGSSWGEFDDVRVVPVESCQ